MPLKLGLFGRKPEAQALEVLREKHRKLSNNMITLKARHKAAQREISFLRAHIAQLEAASTGPKILSGFPDHYPLAPRLEGTRSHWKEAREKLLWAGLSADQALHLELTSLTRLASGAGAAHFPRLLGYDLAARRFEITDQGTSLKVLAAAGKLPAIPELAAQIKTISTALDIAGIAHLDMHADGRNLCLAPDGRLSVIDFDIVALDNVAGSGEIAERLARYSTESFARDIHEIVTRLS